MINNRSKRTVRHAEPRQSLSSAETIAPWGQNGLVKFHEFNVLTEMETE
jgi:hypothetical protein